MKTKLKRTGIMLIAVSVFFSCKKNNTGGDVTIMAFPKHHSKPIKGCTLYVKFGTQDLPSSPTSNYDLRVQGEANEDHLHIEGLRYGKYYFYAEGFDSSIMEVVKGGIPLKIKWSERKKEINLDVPVTE